MFNNFLKNKSYLVGNSLTIVDVYFALIELEIQQAFIDVGFGKSLANLNNHFKMVVTLPEFKGRMGSIKQGKKQILLPIAGSQIQGKDQNKEKKKEKSKQA